MIWMIWNHLRLMKIISRRIDFGSLLIFTVISDYFTHPDFNVPHNFEIPIFRRSWSSPEFQIFRSSMSGTRWSENSEIVWSTFVRNFLKSDWFRRSGPWFLILLWSWIPGLHGSLGETRAGRSREPNILSFISWMFDCLLS